MSVALEAASCVFGLLSITPHKKRIQVSNKVSEKEKKGSA